MNQPGGLSPEMSHYIATGTCPHCGVAILSPDYVSQKREALYRAAALMLWSTGRRAGGNMLAPPGAKVGLAPFGGLRCMRCMKVWYSRPGIRLAPGNIPPFTERPVRRWQQRPETASPPLARPPAASPATPSLPPVTRRPVTSINVAKYQLIGVKDEQQTETLLSTEKRRVPNESSATITRKIGVTNSVTQAVTIDAEKIRISGAQTGAQILGFVNIQGQLQQQLGQRYSVSVQRTLSITDEISIEVPPFHTIEVTITWNTVWLKGNAMLGRGSMPSVEVPYSIPLRLSFDPAPRDVPGTNRGS
jgi:hypothetical protein